MEKHGGFGREIKKMYSFCCLYEICELGMSCWGNVASLSTIAYATMA